MQMVVVGVPVTVGRCTGGGGSLGVWRSVRGRMLLLLHSGVTAAALPPTAVADLARSTD